MASKEASHGETEKKKTKATRPVEKYPPVKPNKGDGSIHGKKLLNGPLFLDDCWCDEEGQITLFFHEMPLHPKAYYEVTLSVPGKKQLDRIEEAVRKVRRVQGG